MESLTPNNLNIKTASLIIPMEIYKNKPTDSILSLLGVHINIIEQIEDETIYGDNIRVFVKYTSLDIDSYSITYINKNDIRPNTYQSDNIMRSTINIDDNIIILMQNEDIELFDEIIPIRIKTRGVQNIDTKYRKHAGEIKYYAEVIINPRNTFCTIIESKRMSYKDNFLENEKKYPTTFEIIYDEKDYRIMVESYSCDIKLLKNLLNVKTTVLSRVNKFSDCVEYNMPYLIKFENIVIENGLYGIIYCHEKRVNSYVCFIKNDRYFIDLETLKYIKNTLEIEEMQYKNVRYFMKN